MSKRITLSDEEYWKLAEMKLRFKTDSLIVIFAKLEEQPKQPIRQESKVNPYMQITGIEPILCACGHPESAHDDGGCLGNGATCMCSKFHEAEVTDDTRTMP